MRSDLIGMPVRIETDGGEKIFIIRAAWVNASGTVSMLCESENGELHQTDADVIRMLVPQVMSSHSASSLTELFPDLLMKYGRREIVAIWTLGLGFDGPLRERIKYGIASFEEGKEGELAAMRAMRDGGGYPEREPEPTLRAKLKEELRAEILAELGR